MIGVDLLDNRDETLAARSIDTFTDRVIVQIVGVVDTGNAGNHRPAIRVENYKLCRLSGHHQEAVISFIQRHRIIRLPVPQRPIRDLMGIPIDNHNLRFGSDIRVDHWF